jgi:hypothetical protein
MPTSNEGGARAGAAKPNQVLALVCAGVILANLDLFIVNVALPDIARDFGGAGLDDLSGSLTAMRSYMPHCLCSSVVWSSDTGATPVFWWALQRLRWLLPLAPPPAMSGCMRKPCGGHQLIETGRIYSVVTKLL